MKNIIKSAVALAVIAPALLTTSCIEETFPTSGVTSQQLGASSKATEALMWEMTAVFNKFDNLGVGRANDWGYGSIMHMRDVMTEDMAIQSSNYDWYSSWEQANYLSGIYMNNQMVWNYYWKLVLAANNLFSATGYESSDDLIASYIGVGSAFRAYSYIDMAQLYEYLPCELTSPITAEGNNVTGLTVPIVTELTTEQDARNNPRATHEEMFNFIMSDLDRAEANIGRSARLSIQMPNLAVVYGLKARAYMWDAGTNPASYAKAAEYARKAIVESGATPMTKDQWLSPTTGFNTYNNAWMWCFSTTKDDRVVTSGILNWTSWCSNETSFGYAAAGPYSMIGKSLYDKISDTDFRKLSYKAPAGGALSGQETTILPDALYKKLPAYSSLKFRPGEGNIGESSIACSVDIPLMRVEEMFLIEAEATTHINPAAGMSLLSSFMKQFRDPNYDSAKAVAARAMDKDVMDGRISAEVAECALQKRIEIWGEGLALYDVKRLNLSVTRKYSGTNFGSTTQFNTNGRPAWTNWVILVSEGNSNAAVRGWNNPSFDGLYK